MWQLSQQDGRSNRERREGEGEKALIAFLKVRNEWELEKRAGRKAKKKTY